MGSTEHCVGWVVTITFSLVVLIIVVSVISTSQCNKQSLERTNDNQGLAEKNKWLVQNVTTMMEQLVQIKRKFEESQSSLMTCRADLTAVKRNATALKKIVTQLIDKNAELNHTQNFQQDAAQKKIHDLNEEIRKYKENLMKSNNELKETKEKFQEEVKRCKGQPVKNTAIRPQDCHISFILSILLALFLMELCS
eukprot:gi/632961918/ref/XP_007897024.1/ PREDICTED: uncharacterized protein LOC103182002 [Callorhinchus milii]